MNKSTLEEKYMNFLKEEGYKPKIIEGYGIVFQYEGDNYSLEFDKTQNNHQIFTLGAGFPYDFKTDVDKIKALALANYVNKAGRIGKIWIDIESGSIDALVSFFLDNDADFKNRFSECCRIVWGVYKTFEQRWYNDRANGA
ncbi:MAG: hypothetical protein LBU25_08125 [Treponema sp.]|jgi:hypothetical protein|nr:hypothetical protein [Treponema sp.]